jgi:AbrB family looped-hinge helix DNA binding protein
MKSIVGERGQIVIPKKIRERLRLEKGTLLDVDTTDDNTAILLKPLRKKRKDWRDWIGAFEGEGLTGEYLKEKKKEKEREKRRWRK